MSTPAASAQRAPMSNSVKAAELLDEYDSSHPEASGSSASKRGNPFTCAACAALLSSGYLVLLNLVFFVLGIIVLSLGAYAQAEKVGGQSVPAGLIFSGVMVSLCALIGIWGAKRRSRFLLLVYIVLFSIVIFLEFVLAVVLLAKRDEIAPWFTDVWVEASNATRANIQDVNNCCGFSEEYPEPPGGVELCPRNDRGIVYSDYCLPKLENLARSSATAAGGVALVFALIEILGVFLAQMLRNSTSNAQFSDDASSAVPPPPGSRRIR